MSAAQQIENIQEKLSWHWRNSMQVVRFFAFDARAALPVMLLLFNMLNPYMWALFVLNLTFFRFLEQKGLTVPAAIRNFRAWMVGKDRPGYIKVKHRRFQDFG